MRCPAAVLRNEGERPARVEFDERRWFDLFGDDDRVLFETDSCAAASAQRGQYSFRDVFDINIFRTQVFVRQVLEFRNISIRD